MLCRKKAESFGRVGDASLPKKAIMRYPLRSLLFISPGPVTSAYPELVLHKQLLLCVLKILALAFQGGFQQAGRMPAFLKVRI
jgi:hypothetical protein